MDAGQKKALTCGTETVLLVDDESAVRKYMRRVLESHGYRVLDAGNGDDAMQVARRYGDRIDLLLTDDVLPGMQGTEVIRQFRELRPGVPALRMSGYPEHLGEYKDLGVRYLGKPFSSERLLVRVREVLDMTPAAV
jgi:DNA-binding response OmpR family regulator